MNRTATAHIDPECVAPLEALLSLVGGPIDLHDIPACRARLQEAFAAVDIPAPDVDGVATQDQLVPGALGAPDVAIRIFQPAARSTTLPALLWIHGGGYVLGDMAADDLFAKQLVAAVECVVVTVEYRLAPEHSFPAALDDCYAALTWLAAHTEELNVDPARITIGGSSAGGGLAAGLALLARDRGEVPVAFQLLIYPMLDDRNVTPAGDDLSDTLVWSRANNFHGWRAYLGQTPGTDGVSPYAAAARATDLAGLPPTYLMVGTLDLFLDEDIAYAQRLMAAGVPTELHVYPGAYHAFDGFAPDAGVSRRFAAERDDVLRRALHRS
jgi:acetyl esterase/lipase